MTKVLFVCLGNICRSPTAEGVFRELARRRGMDGTLFVDSAGTSGWHIDAPPDSRARAEAKRRGISLEDLRSRQVNQADFERFDYVVAMDESNMADLEEICPAQFRERLFLFTRFARDAAPGGVPDPYYGGADGFAKVFDLITECAGGLLDHIIAERQKEGAR